MIQNLTEEAKRHSNLARRKRVKQAIERESKQPKSCPATAVGIFGPARSVTRPSTRPTQMVDHLFNQAAVEFSGRTLKSAATGALPGAYIGRMVGRWRTTVPDGQGSEGRPVDPR